MSRKQTFWIVVLFLLVLLSGLTVNMPVRQLFRVVEIPAELKLKGLEGSISAGSAKIINVQGFNLTDVTYNLQPVCLIRAAICYQFHSEDKQLLLNIEVSALTQSVAVTSSQILLDSSIFNNFNQMMFKPLGQFAVHIENITLENNRLSNLIANLDWIGAGIEGEDQILGNYTATIHSAPDKLKIKLDDKDSLLSVMGDIGISWSGQYDIDLQFESRPALNKAVISVLEMMTKRSGLNQFSVKRTGRVPPESQKYIKLFNLNSEL